jgi:hypothetical protein
MLEQNVETLLKRCWREPSPAEIEESLARFEKRLAPPAHGRWLAALAAGLVMALAVWMTLPRTPQQARAVAAPQDPE